MQTVEIVDNAEVAAGTVDIVAATEWQPYSTVGSPNSCLCRLQQGKKGSYFRPERSLLRAETLRLGTGRLGKSCFSGGNNFEVDEQNF